MRDLLLGSQEPESMSRYKQSKVKQCGRGTHSKSNANDDTSMCASRAKSEAIVKHIGMKK
jgi:hypothetical protein